MPDIPLMTGTSSVNCAMPIIGPPEMTLATSPLSAAGLFDEARDTSVPMRAMKFAGFDHGRAR